MTTILLALLLLGIFTVVGTAVCALLLKSNQLRTSELLISPVVGSGFILVIAVVLNRILALPLGHQAPWILLACVLSSVAWLMWRRPRVEYRGVAAPWSIVVIGVACLGFPSLLAGPNWMAYANGDAIYYLSGALRLLEYGFFSPGSDQAQAIYSSGTDYSLASFAPQVELGARSGAETLLAAMSGFMQADPFITYMPLMLALAGACALAGAAVVAQVSNRRWASAMAALALCVLPLAVYSVQNQLLAQTFGIGLLLGVAFACQRYVFVIDDAVSTSDMTHGSEGERSPTSFTRNVAGVKRVAGQSVFLGVPALALLLVYPEIVPFLTIGFILCAGFALLNARSLTAVSWAVISCATSLVVVGLVVTRSLASTFRFLLSETIAGQSRGGAGDITLFPDFIVPTGISAFWGLHAFYAPPASAPLGTLVFLLGALLSVGALVAIVVVALKRVLVGWIAAAMVVLLAYFVWQQSGFAAFKLALWAQYLVWPSLAIAVGLITKVTMRRAALATTALVLTLALPTSVMYVGRSIPGTSGSLAQAPQLTREALAHIDAKIDSARVEGRPILIEDPNSFVRSYVLLKSRGLVSSGGAYSTSAPAFAGTHAGAVIRAKFGPYDVELRPATEDRDMAKGVEPVRLRVPSADVFAPRGEFVSDLDLVAGGQPSLTFVPSSVGGLPDQGLAESSFSPAEIDPIWGREIQAFRRFALFRIDNYQPGLRVEISLTATFSPQFDYELPKPSLIGEEVANFGVVGSGAARSISAPIRPKWINGFPYILMDMGRTPGYPPVSQALVFPLWNSEVRRDPRSSSAYVRRLMVLTPEEARQTLQQRPSDVTLETLRDPDVRYSGIFEDGWLSADAWIDVDTGKGSRTIIVKGQPAGDGTSGNLEIRCGQARGVVPISRNPLNFSLFISDADSGCRLGITADEEARVSAGPRVLYLTKVSVN